MKFIVFFAGLFACFNVLGQMGASLPPAEIVKPLKEGDKLPDLMLNERWDTTAFKGIRRFSDLKGKLIILDFWNSACASCLQNFPKLEQLQKKFGDRIQIICVNDWEDRLQLEKRLNINEFLKEGMPDLPVLVDTKELLALFPSPNGATGYHVWIDSTGIVRSIGSPLNTYESKIEDFLSGNKVSFLNAGFFYAKNEQPLYEQMSGGHQLSFKDGSFFTLFNYKYGPIGGGAHAINVVDSVTGTIRNTFVNFNALDLYRFVFDKYIQEEENKMIYQPYCGLTYYNYFQLETSDSMRYANLWPYNSYTPVTGQRAQRERQSGNAIISKWYTDTGFIKSQYCYEQIVPLGTTEEERRLGMLKDMNKCFGKLYHTVIKMEKKKISCYVLVRSPKGNELKSGTGKRRSTPIMLNGKKMMQFGNISLKQALLSVLPANNILGDYFLLDGTGYSLPVDITLPDMKEINTLDGIKSVIKPYGLDIIMEELDMNMIVVKDKSLNTTRL